MDANKAVAEQLNLVTFGCLESNNGSLSSPVDSVDGGTNSKSSDGYNHYNMIQQYLKHSFLPILNPVDEDTSSSPAAAGNSSSNLYALNETNDKLNAVNKCMKDLDISLEQIQRGDGIIRPVFTTMPELLTAAGQTNASELKNLLEKYNPSNVDQLFSTAFDPPLTQIMGDTPELRVAI